MGRTLDISVIGAGEMGHGFVIHFTRFGHNVRLVDHRERNIDQAKSRIHETVAWLQNMDRIEQSPSDILESTTFTIDQSEGVKGTDLVLETVSEQLSVKETVLSNAGKAAPDGAVLATNTSSLSIAEISNRIPEHASRIIGCHWWNPPYIMPLVEVVRGNETSDDVVDFVTEFVEDVNRTPLLVEHEVPGFIWNRIQFAVLRECIHLYEEGVASLSDIDTAVRDGYALRTAVIGPLATMDLAGIDLFQSIAKEIYPDLCDSDRPHQMLEEYIEEGKTGAKAGQGVYNYDQSIQELTRQRDEKILRLNSVLGDMAKQD